jgi:hypothetical protein
VIVSLKTGEIWKISKYNPRFVVRNESPEQFWSLVASYSIIGLTVASLSAWILIDVFRELLTGVRSKNSSREVKKLISRGQKTHPE